MKKLASGHDHAMARTAASLAGVDPGRTIESASPKRDHYSEDAVSVVRHLKVVKVSQSCFLLVKH